MNLLCRIFGHKIDPIDKVMLEIKNSSLNSKNLDYQVRCLRCKTKLIIKETK